MEFLLQELKKNNIIKKGHFKLTSGMHSDTYINKDLITSNKEIFDMVISGFSNYIYACLVDREMIITSPAVAGIPYGVATAFHNHMQFLYPEKDESEEMYFRRGFPDIIKGRDVLIIEDIITTGKSVDSTAAAIRACGGNPYGLLCIWNRTGYKPMWTKFSKTLITEKVISYDAANCPLCKKGIKLEDPKNAMQQM